MPIKREKTINVCVDVGKHELDGFIRERGIHFSVNNSPGSIPAALNRLARYHLLSIFEEAAGKQKKAALTACMRKMIVILNAMIKNQSDWNENYA